MSSSNYSVNNSVSSGNINKNYLVYIFIGESSSPAVASWIPEQICLSSQSQWNDLSSSLMEMVNSIPLVKHMSSIAQVMGKVNDISGGVLGAKVNTKYAHFLAWAGNNPLEISLDLQFNAYEDAEKEVIQPIKNLMACTMPAELTSDGLFISPPGPKLADVIKNSGNGKGSSLSSSNWIKSAVTGINSEYNQITKNTTDSRGILLRFGSFMQIGNLVVKNVNPKFDSMFTKNGLPISAECNVTFQMVYPPTLKDLENMFLTGSNRIDNSSSSNY